MDAINVILNLNLILMNNWSSRTKQSVLEEEIKKQKIRNILAIISGNDTGK